MRPKGRKPMAKCGVCPVCLALWELYDDGKLPIHAYTAGLACDGSRKVPMPQCTQCGQYQMHHERHGSPGCPGVYPETT